VPDAPNCLLSGARFDEGGGEFIGGNGKCILKDKSGRIVGEGTKTVTFVKRKSTLTTWTRKNQLCGYFKTHLGSMALLSWKET